MERIIIFNQPAIITKVDAGLKFIVMRYELENPTTVCLYNTSNRVVGTLTRLDSGAVEVAVDLDYFTLLTETLLQEAVQLLY